MKSLIYHVYPNNDVFPHNTNGKECDCIPDTELDEHGNIIIVHNAYDGRDIIEEVERGR